jgi:hypothetical protein
LVRIPDGTVAIRTEVFRGFAQFLEVDVLDQDMAASFEILRNASFIHNHTIGRYVVWLLVSSKNSPKKWSLLRGIRSVSVP